MKRPACFQRQTGACRSCGPAACQPCRGHEEPVGRKTHSDQLAEDKAQSALRPVRQADEAINHEPPDRAQREKRSTPHRRTGVQRRKRSTPIAERVSSGRRACHSNRRTGPRTESYVKSVVSARAACEGLITPLRQHSLVGDRGRANHPPVGPVQQGSRTQVSMVGNLGKSLTAHSLSTARDPQKRACGSPFEDCRQIVHKT